MFTLNLLLCFLGICYGSFVGSYIVRFPRIIDPESNITMSYPRSKCESCGEMLKVHMLIPLLSYLVQKGKCSYCRIFEIYKICTRLHRSKLKMLGDGGEKQPIWVKCQQCFAQCSFFFFPFSDFIQVH